MVVGSVGLAFRGSFVCGFLGGASGLGLVELTEGGVDCIPVGPGSLPAHLASRSF